MHRTKRRGSRVKDKKVAQKLLGTAAVAAFPADSRNELIHTMSMIENNEEKNKIWQQLKTKLHSTMVAFGSGSVQLPKLMDTFRSDWGSELTSYAVQLGFGSNDAAVYKMLLTMPGEVESGFVSSTGTFAFKVIPKAETSDNLSKIDQSNQYQNEMRKSFARRRASMNNVFLRPPHFNHSFHVNPSFRPPPPPPMPFNLSGPISNGPRFPGLIVRLPNHANAHRRVSLVNGFHQPPPHFASPFHAQPPPRPPSPFAMSSPNPNPARVTPTGPSPSRLQKQIEQILLSARGRLPSAGHPPIVRKVNNHLQTQQQTEKKEQIQVVVQEVERRHDVHQKRSQSPKVEDEWETIIAQLIQHFERLKLSG